VSLWRILRPRERQVVRLVLEDVSTKEIARQLDLSPNTVETYIRNISLRLPDCPRRGARKIRVAFSGSPPDDMDNPTRLARTG
jgi:FixJ family two-component response regulator